MKQPNKQSNNEKLKFGAISKKWYSVDGSQSVVKSVQMHGWNITLNVSQSLSVANLSERQGLRSAKSKNIVSYKQKLKLQEVKRLRVSGLKMWNNLPKRIKSTVTAEAFVWI